LLTRSVKDDLAVHDSASITEEPRRTRSDEFKKLDELRLARVKRRAARPVGGVLLSGFQVTSRQVVYEAERVILA